MEDEDLDELARLSASSRQFAIAVVLAIVLAPFVGWLLGAVMHTSAIVVAGGVVASLVAAMFVSMQVRTRPDRFPTILALRTRAQEVAYVVTITRGKHVVALAGREGDLLAKPLVLKGTAMVASPHTALAIVAAQSAQLTRALAIIAQRCPQARATRISDTWGLASAGNLAKKAIAALPPA